MKRPLRMAAAGLVAVAALVTGGAGHTVPPQAAPGAKASKPRAALSPSYYEVPAQSQAGTLDIVALFTNRRGNLIIEYTTGHSPNVLTFYFDTTSRTENNSAIAAKLANSSTLPGQYVAEHGWTRLEFAFGALRLDKDHWVKHGHLGGPLCQWPFDGFLSLVDSHGKVHRVSFLRRLDRTRTFVFQVWCERGPGETKLRVDYLNVSPAIYAGGDGTFFLVFRGFPYVLHFGVSLNNDFFKTHHELVMIPTSLIEKYFFKINEIGMPPQDAVDATEAAIAAITQKRPTTPTATPRKVNHP